SIVMKMQCGSVSLILTGDKTKAEIKHLIGRFQKCNCVKDLETDILLATHHGSEGDFVEKWAEVTNPQRLVFSSGRSSFSHPRSAAVFGHVSKSSRLREVKWHFVQFQGDSRNPAETFRSIFREQPCSEDRARGYTHAVTNKAVFVTGSQGNVTFTTSNPFTYLIKEKWDGLGQAINNFLPAPKFPDGSPIFPESISLSGVEDVDLKILFQRLSGKTFLKELNLEGHPIKKIPVDELCAFIRNTPALLRMNLKKITFPQKAAEKIKTAWDNRGLILDAPA
ncbi:MAG: hypothetical protein Q8Q56_02140, partial [Alphaproteobacteria bacterium]|nr:hypothetical protein [Alphaproteobacteria bacterium]